MKKGCVYGDGGRGGWLVEEIRDKLFVSLLVKQGCSAFLVVLIITARTYFNTTLLKKTH